MLPVIIAAGAALLLLGGKKKKASKSPRISATLTVTQRSGRGKSGTSTTSNSHTPGATDQAPKFWSKTVEQSNDGAQTVTMKLENDGTYTILYQTYAWRAAKPGRLYESRKDGGFTTLEFVTKGVPVQYADDLIQALETLYVTPNRVEKSKELNRNNWIVDPVPRAAAGPYNCARGNYGPPTIKWASCSLNWAYRNDVPVKMYYAGKNLLKVMWPWGLLAIGPADRREEVWAAGLDAAQAVHERGLRSAVTDLR